MEQWAARLRGSRHSGRFGVARIVSCGAKPQNGAMADAAARAFWIAAPGRGEIRTESLPTASADDVLVRALYSGISRGTEALVFQGRVPASEYQRMRAPFQAGNFPAPIKYGYASVGRIETRSARPEGPDGLRAVSAPDPLRRTRTVRARAARRRAAGARGAGRQPRNRHQRAVGRAAAHRRSNRRRRRRRRSAASSRGWRAAFRAATWSWSTSTRSARPSRTSSACGLPRQTPIWEGADVVIHASGSPAGLDLALGVAGFEATRRRDELVRRPAGAAAARRGVSARSV